MMNSVDTPFIVDVMSMLNFVKSSFNNEFPYSFDIKILNNYNKKYIKQEIEETCNDIAYKTFTELDYPYCVADIKEVDGYIIIVFSQSVEVGYFNDFS